MKTIEINKTVTTEQSTIQNSCFNSIFISQRKYSIIRKAVMLVIISAFLLINSNIIKAQAWEKRSIVLSPGFGISQFFELDNGYYDGSSRIHTSYGHTTFQLNLQGEFGIHKYVGLGFTTGIGGRRNLNHEYIGELNIPIGMIANFHFFQLISDKSGKNIHADKLDIYFGACIGSGVAFTYYTNNTKITPLAFGGVHFGVRYYIAPKVALNCEVGFGKSLALLGFSFKL